MIVSIDDLSQDIIGNWPWSRDKQAELIKNILGLNPKVLGYDIILTDNIKDEGTKEITLLAKNGKAIFASDLDDRTIFGKDEKNLGIVNFNKIRDKVFTQQTSFECKNSFGVNMYLKAIGKDISCVNRVSEMLRINKIFFKDSERIRINYKYTEKNIKHISAYKFFLDKESLRNEIENKVVFIGVTSKDLHDFHGTPISKDEMSGVMIHANVYSNLIEKNILLEPYDIWVIISGTIFLLLLFITITKLGVLKGFFASWFCYIGLIASSYLLKSYGIYYNIFYILVVSILILTSESLVGFLAEKSRKEFIYNTFGRYIPKEYVNRILKDPSLLELGGEEKELTILFSDIRGFTSFSETVSPKKLVLLLNKYLDYGTKAVEKYNGIVDKFIGDAIMAFWGAPIEDKLQADHSLGSAIEMVNLLKKFNSENNQEFRIGIGISTGNVVVGNIGAKRRMNYTVIGDEVNLASRLEGLTKLYEVKIIFSEHTEKRLINREKFVYRKLDKVCVKGKKKPIEIYELIGYNKDCTKEEKNLKTKYEEGLELYFSGDFKLAKKVLSGLINDIPSQVILQRIDSMNEKAPSEWNGVFEIKTK